MGGRRCVFVAVHGWGPGGLGTLGEPQSTGCTVATAGNKSRHRPRKIGHAAAQVQRQAAAAGSPLGHLGDVQGPQGERQVRAKAHQAGRAGGHAVGAGALLGSSALLKRVVVVVGGGGLKGGAEGSNLISTLQIGQPNTMGSLGCSQASAGQAALQPGALPTSGPCCALLTRRRPHLRDPAHQAAAHKVLHLAQHQRRLHVPVARRSGADGAAGSSRSGLPAAGGRPQRLLKRGRQRVANPARKCTQMSSGLACQGAAA